MSAMLATTIDTFPYTRPSPADATAHEYGRTQAHRGYPATRPLEYDDRAARAYFAGHSVGRAEFEAAWSMGQTDGVTCRPSNPPAEWSDDLKGVYIDGYGDGEQILVARNRAVGAQFEEERTWAKFVRSHGMAY